jgi:hypothetical protein
MGYHTLNNESVKLLHNLADLQHPHLKGDNHTGRLIDKVFNGDKMSKSEIFDCGKYYQRMLEQLRTFEGREDYNEYLNAILSFKWKF